MTFRASSSGRPLAVLRFVDYRPWKAAYSTSARRCSCRSRVAAGPRSTAAMFIKRIERIIGLSIT